MKIEDIIKQRLGDSCLVCGMAADMAGVFIPEDPESWGAERGHQIAVRYCLCKPCCPTADKEGRIEKILRHELSEGRVRICRDRGTGNHP